MSSVSSHPRSAADHPNELLKLTRELGYRHGHWQVFADFVEMAAISISNAIDVTSREKRERRYMEVIKRYKPEELGVFPQLLATLTMALEEETADVLGKTFHDLELHNKWSGQYFSPYPLCRMMARMTLGDKPEIEAKLSDRGFVTSMEPAAGSGAMIIALAHEMREAGINYQQHLHVTAVDVDPKCVHMSYLQCSLLHIPAIVIHGNSLSLEEFDHWYTPAHIMGAWKWKLPSPGNGGHPVETVPPPSQAPAQPDDKKTPTRPTQLGLF